MAECRGCFRQMAESTSCALETVAFAVDSGGVELPRIPWGSGSIPAVSDRCHDCGVEHGGFHHLDCDMEECPICAGQLISCTHAERAMIMYGDGLFPERSHMGDSGD